MDERHEVEYPQPRAAFTDGEFLCINNEDENNQENAWEGVQWSCSDLAINCVEQGSREKMFSSVQGDQKVVVCFFLSVQIVSQDLFQNMFGYANGTNTHPQFVRRKCCSLPTTKKIQ